MDRFNLTKEKKDEMLKSIKDYFYNEKGEDLGDLATMMLLDFFIKELAPEFYNQGVNDSYVYIHEKIEDLFSLQIYKR